MILMPMPKNMNVKTGYFNLLHNTEIVLDNDCNFDDLESAKILREEIRDVIGFQLSITKSSCHEDKNSIYLKIQEQINSSYELNVSSDAIKICAKDSTGLFYGVQTLRQIVRTEGVKISCLDIEDSPYFKNRGFYHDVTRGKVPTLETLKELVDKISFYKINQLQLYIEHTFAFKDESEAWIGSDPLTPEEILTLDEYCIKRHVELVPSLATFGHLYDVLSTNSFNHLCELENTLALPFSWEYRRKHHTLDVSNPESFQFIKNRIDEFIPLFTSDKFNICCDETFDLGEGKSKELAQKVGKERLYVDFLNKIIKHVRSHNKTVMFWNDVIIKYPELFDELNKDELTCLTWHYEVLPESLDEIRIVSETGMPQYVCPGVSGWKRIVNDLDMAYNNINKMIQIGVKHGAIGVLNTDWGDGGHLNNLSNSLPGMIYGAALSWNPFLEEEFSNMDKKISQLEFGDKSGDLVGLLRKLGQQQTVWWERVALWKDIRLHNVTINKAYECVDDIFTYTEQEIIDTYKKIQEIKAELLNLSVNIPDKLKLCMQEFYIAAQGLMLLQALILIIQKYDLKRKIDTIIHEPRELAKLFEYWLVDFAKLWRIRNKESELFRIRETLVEICGFLRKIKST